MTRVVQICECLCLLALTAVLVCACLLVRSAQRTVEAIPGEITDTRTALVGEVQQTRADLLAAVDAQSKAIRGDAMAAIGDTRKDLTVRLDRALDTVQSTAVAADSRLKEVTDTMRGFREDVREPLKATTALVTDAKDSWDDLYWDVKASVESATVAARGVAETSEAIGKAAPAIAQSVAGIGQSADGIAADIHTATSDFVRPKTFWQKLRSIGETVGKVAARFI